MISDQIPGQSFIPKPDFLLNQIWKTPTTTNISHTHSVAVLFWSVYLHVVISQRCEIVWDVADGSLWKWFVCGWIIEQILLSAFCAQSLLSCKPYICPNISQMQLMLTDCAVIWFWASRLTGVSKGPLIKILQARCVYIHRDTPRSRLAHKPHAGII